MVRALALLFLLPSIAMAQTVEVQQPRVPAGNRAYSEIVHQLTDDKVALTFQIETLKDQIADLQKKIDQAPKEEKKN